MTLLSLEIERLNSNAKESLREKGELEKEGERLRRENGSLRR